MRNYMLTTTALIACATASLANAQTTPNASPTDTATGVQAESGDASGARSGLADIVVTAQRRTETAQRAAIPISVVSGASLVSAGISQSNTLGSVVPALTVESVGPSTAFFVRGVGNFSVAVTSDPAVAFNVDGVYIGRNTSVTTTFFDLDRVEVLKGPQGTLYGRNATAGAINVLPTQPKLGVLSAEGGASYGNYKAFSADAAINVPIGQDGALRISGIVNDRGGFYSDGTSNDKSHALRVQMKANLTPDLTVRVSGDYAHLGGTGEGQTYFDTYSCTAPKACTVTPTGISRSDGNLSRASQAFWTSLPTLSVAGRDRDPFPAVFQNSNFYGATGDIEWKTGAGALTLIPAVRFDHVRNLNPAGGLELSNDQKDIQYSVEGRFAGKINLFDYTVGMYYFNERVNLHNGTVVGGSVLNLQDPTKVNTQSYAPFGRLTANLTHQLRLVGGLRYTHDSKQFSATTNEIVEVCVLPTGCPNAILPISTPYPSGEPFALPSTVTGVIPAMGNGPAHTTYAPRPGLTPGTLIFRNDYAFNNQLSTGKITYRGAIEFDVAAKSLLYASVESGFRSGGFSSSVGYETYQPETITAYTIGSKNRFFDNRVQLNVEGFLWKYNNQQVAHAGLDNVNRAGNFTQNIGRSTIKGVEVEGRVLVTPTTMVSADVQYLDAKNNTFVYQQAKALGVPNTNCAVSASTTNTSVFNIDCSGLPAYNSPKLTLNLGAEQTIPIGDYRLTLHGDTQYKTSRYTYFDYQPEQLQRASWTTNAQVTFGPASAGWAISGYVRNIENKRLLVAPVAFLGLLAGYTTDPRTYGVRLSGKF